jgi:hypothetical protein
VLNLCAYGSDNVSNPNIFGFVYALSPSACGSRKMLDPMSNILPSKTWLCPYIKQTHNN